MGDVVRYAGMCGKWLAWYDLRHVLIAPFTCYPLLLSFLVPAIFWLLIMPPLIRRGNGFLFFFGTGSVWLYFVLGLWSQFICMGLWLQANELLGKRRSLLFGFASLTYIPFIGFLAAKIVPDGILWLGVMVMFSYNGGQFLSGGGAWVPVLSLLFHVCPLVWLRGLFLEWTTREKTLFGITSLQYLGRLQIFLFMGWDMELSRVEQVLCVVWWLAVGVFFLNSFMLDWLCIGGLCRGVT